ncbi:MAG: elongation factor Ts [Candidatus Omnitrophica bacterium]|nr:elongation factor Ts [Candidatus Omnitrophota bacterium]
MSLDAIKRLRELTSVGINECKNALGESGGDFDKALEILRRRGIQVAEKRGGRTASQGLVDAYVHFGGNLGALVEINCETDFVARTDVFKKFTRDVAMQVAAANPKYIKREDVPASELEGLKNADDYIKQVCLFEQSFVKDSKLTMSDYLRDVIAQTGENVVIRRFTRFSLGTGDEPR